MGGAKRRDQRTGKPLRHVTHKRRAKADQHTKIDSNRILGSQPRGGLEKVQKAGRGRFDRKYSRVSWSRDLFGGK